VKCPSGSADILVRLNPGSAFLVSSVQAALERQRK
jgi:hypothetical protein